jgi:hypothetical protein
VRLEVTRKEAGLIYLLLRFSEEEERESLEEKLLESSFFSPFRSPEDFLESIF